MLLRNARVDGTVVDVLIGGGTITAIGPDLPTPSGAPVVDLGGQSLVPGLWDNHVHFSQWSLQRQRLDVSTAESAAAVAAIVADAVAAGAADDPIVGVGFRDGLWPDAPTVAPLDAAAGERAVVLVSGDLHTTWLNSAALRLYGHSGHPTGVLVEDDAFEIVRRINTTPDARLDAWADSAAVQAAARGVVGIVDLEMDWNLDTWVRRIAGGTDSLRVEFGVYPQHLASAVGLGLRTGQAHGDLLTVGRLKVLTDGSLNTRTAYTYDEYPGLEGQPHSRGLLTIQPDDLLALMREAAAAGLESTVHAIGDHANTVALDAFEAIGMPGRIEHAQLVHSDDIPRFAELGVVASVQPDHALDDRDVADHYWAGRTGRAFALRSLLDAGAQLALGSDAPVSPLDPWVSIAAAVKRTRPGGEEWHPEQSITVGEALAASVRTRVAVGQPADLAVLPVEPGSAASDDLGTMPVSATLLGGRFTHFTL
jgi:predicted amidohydrolase YtcJ